MKVTVTNMPNDGAYVHNYIKEEEEEEQEEEEERKEEE